GGPRAQVFSALGIPRAAFDLPLFGAEVVCISGSVTVVVLDWIPLFPNSLYLDGLPAIRRRFDHFPSGGDLPAWAAESFSPAVLFSRPRGAVPDADILQAFTTYLVGYLNLCDQTMPHGNPRRTRTAQLRYCTAHESHDPGGAMLAKIFGGEWAAGYARAFLFHLGRRSR
ncbi:MAG: phytochromobilin:ferredoxin oxidoreductase, partial [Chloroflexota bacterium]|nr:phytochromobilin:ferredoxin oxidoreductase [Chloroflexota bacterium]